MGALGEGDFDAFLGDLDFGRGIQEMPEQLAGLGGFISGEPATQHPIESARHLGQRDVEIDLGVATLGRRYCGGINRPWPCRVALGQ